MTKSARGETGRRKRLKISRDRPHAGSNPAARTNSLLQRNPLVLKLREKGKIKECVPGLRKDIYTQLAEKYGVDRYRVKKICYMYTMSGAMTKEELFAKIEEIIDSEE